ncbi:MAG: saccharopine dehydrogenase NADP-binding domain-containing protein [Candidatus Thorarchaeota archaeon]|nr:saccharopine dehydrogenase NADP-binding domain-containing protein [Candidatus Thorarchaeota archaeon]
MSGNKERVFAVLGAGRQGTAAAYDLAKFGNAKAVIIADMNLEAAKKSAARVNNLLNTDLTQAQLLDITHQDELVDFLAGVNTVLSAVPYYFNLEIAKAAVAAGTNMCDLGGNTNLVMEQLKLDSKAKAANISIIPDCGQVPGMGTTLCVFAMSLLDKPEEVYMWDGGLPQKPRPPFNYLQTFHIDGLINEYYGTTEFLRNGKIIEVPCFTEFEEIEFPPPAGRLEAFTTSGGTSTAPRTFKGKLKAYQNKTVRFPGSFIQLKTMNDLGLFDPNEIEVGSTTITPRAVFAKLFGPKVNFPEDKDMVVIRIICKGKNKGRPAEAQVDVMDFYDEETGFTSMERTTGWSAAIVALMMADGRAKKGAVPLELAISSPEFVQELRRRGINVKEQLKYTNES